MSKKFSDFPLRENPDNLQIVGYDTLQEVRIPAEKIISLIDLSESHSAISIHDSAITAHLGIRTKLRNYATANSVNNLVGNINSMADYMNKKNNEWKPCPDWWDIEAIFQADPDPNKRFIMLVTDNNHNFTLENTTLENSITYFKTSDSHIYNTANITHEWNITKDKPCSKGYKTRYVIVYSNDRNISCNLSPFDVKYVYFGNNSILSSLIVSNTNRILESIQMDNTVTALTTSTLLFSCISLISVTIPHGLTSIEDSAFRNCFSLASITIPNSVTNIGNSAFDGCFSLAFVTIPNSVTNIEDYAFANCFSFVSITIPNSVTNIGDSAFAACLSLTSVTIPNSVTNIGYSAFRSCESLVSITIPNSVTSIGNAFSNCTSLISIKIEDGWIAPPFSIAESSQLSISSILNMFNKLGAVPSTSSQGIIYLGTTNLGKLTTIEKAIATNKGYTLI